MPQFANMSVPAPVRSRHARALSPPQRRRTAESAFAAVAVLYAVLLAFAVIVVWERFSDAESNVAKEAGGAATIYRLSQGISGEPGLALRTALTHYLNETISDEWPAMERGHNSPSARQALDAVLYTSLC
jgi:Protein of unknown function (DUF4239)